MSQTQSAPYAAPPVYDAWRRAVMDEMGLREAAMRAGAAPGGPGALASARPNGPGTAPAPVLAAPPPGHGPQKGPVAKFLAKNAFGELAERQSIDPAKTGRITRMKSDGRASAVSLNANGRQLNGNFFSAEGHNLLTEGKPDTTRPAVLLMTGSGGSAQDQGLDMAEFYAQNGASVLSVNFGGFGDSSPNDPSEQSLYEDSTAMLQHLVDLGYDPGNIIIHGYSLGGAVAGKLQAANEAAGHTFKGAVLDRPMVSMVSGVETRTFGKVVHPIAALARSTVGRLSARDALLNGQGTTPMVLTADEGDFARHGEELRDKLRNAGRTISGQTTGEDHFEHQAMLRMNDTELRTLINGGAAPPPKPELKRWIDRDKLRVQAEQAISNADFTARQYATRIAALAAAPQPPTAGSLRTQVSIGLSNLQTALDLSRAQYGNQTAIQKPAAEAILASARNSMMTLVSMLTVRNEDVTVPPALVDAVLTRCEKARAALLAAGGVGPAGMTEEQELLAAVKDLNHFRAAGADLPDEAEDFIDEIDQLKRDILQANMDRARTAQAALLKLGRARRPRPGATRARPDTGGNGDQA